TYHIFGMAGNFLETVIAPIVQSLCNPVSFNYQGTIIICTYKFIPNNLYIPRLGGSTLDQVKGVLIEQSSHFMVEYPLIGCRVPNAIMYYGSIHGTKIVTGSKICKRGVFINVGNTIVEPQPKITSIIDEGTKDRIVL